MKIFCKELNKEFDTQEQMFLELVKSESKIIELKKAAIKDSDSVNSLFIAKNDVQKGLDFVKEGFVYPVINTTNFMDSHGDVHFPDLWNKTLKEKTKKIFYALEHQLKLENIIAFPNDVRAFVKNIEWKDLGFKFDGETQALIFEIPKDKIKIPKIKELLEEKTAFENSVRMRYITMNLAIKSDSPDLAKQRKVWDDRISLIANKDYAESEGYFWAVDEASIEKEGSLCLFGSNEATPILYEAGASTSKNEPSKDTQPGVKKVFIN